MTNIDWCAVSQSWVATPCPPDHEDCGRSFGPVNLETERPKVLADLLNVIRRAVTERGDDEEVFERLERAYGLATGRHLGCEDW